MVRLRMWDMKKSENASCSCRTLVRASLPIRAAAASVNAETDIRRRIWPTMQASPKKSPGPRIETTASLPRSDSTVTLNLPFWM